MLFMLGCFLSIACSAYAADRKSVVIPRVAKGPAIAGAMTDPLWKRGAQLTDFSSINSARITQATSARVLYDNDNLYIAVRCEEANMDKLVANLTGCTDTAWKDDSVELFFDTAESHRMYLHYCLTPLRAYFQEKRISKNDSEMGWRSDWRTATARDAKGWTLTVSIPFKDLGISPTTGLQFGMNICRARKPVTEEYSAWSHTPDTFGEPSCFGDVLLGDEYGKCDGVRLLSWGDMDLEPVYALSNSVKISLPKRSRSTTYKTILRSFVGGKATYTKIVNTSLPKGRSTITSIPYAASPNGATWKLTVLSGGKTVFSSERRVEAISSKKRVWQINDPLYKELLSKTPAGHQQNGAIYWMHTYSPYTVQPFAKEYGIRYSNEEALREIAEQKLLPICEATTLSDPFLTKMADKYHFKVLFYPSIRRWTAPDAPIVEGSSLMIDPRSRELYFNDLKNGLSKWRKYIWGIYSGDEMTEWSISQVVSLYQDHRNDYPYINQLNEQIKNEYGFGKYGIPESKTDENPYRWIALRRWMSNYLAGWQKEVYQTVQQIAPEIKVISFDPVCGHKPVGFDRMSPYFDVATQQLYPPTDPNRQQFGFTTKMVSDLTGKPTWPCTHVEHYPYSTTVEEVRELLSEIQRNGGKGYHFWLKDEIGNNSASGFLLATKWGFPERWRALCELNRMNSSMNEVAIPKDPDSAIFYSETDYQAVSEKAVQFPYIYSNEPEWAYTFFGPSARTWFKFVNEGMIQDNKVDLSSFKAITIPAAKYELRDVAESLLRYAEGGGTLIIGDPEAFSSDAAGEGLQSVRDKLMGPLPVLMHVRKTFTFLQTCSMKKLRGKTLPITGDVYTMKPGNGAEVMATFPDGSPAVWNNPVGRGRVIVFASNPFTEKAISIPAWKDFFKAFSEELRLKTDRSIWRFKLPEYRTVTQPQPSGVCLTGNYIRWWQDRPSFLHNAEIGGTYSYSVLPDAIRDTAAMPVPFSKGKLTDRKNAYSTLKKDLKPENFVVSWKTEKPIDVTFDLLTPKDVTRMNLWYSGELPATQVQGSVDGKTWTTIGSSLGKPFQKLENGLEDILDVSIPTMSPRSIRYLRMRIGARTAGNPLTLVECEIWGK